jgi:hypothetical protein
VGGKSEGEKRVKRLFAVHPTCHLTKNSKEGVNESHYRIKANDAISVAMIV